MEYVNLYSIGGVPNCVKIIAIDPYEVVAYKFCDPVLQFLYQDHIKYNYFATELQDGTDCWSHFMSSKYAKYTEEEVKSYNPDGILIPLFVYSDGVALGLRQKVYELLMILSVSSCMMYVSGPCEPPIRTL